jgi:hypothetical protein
VSRENIGTIHVDITPLLVLAIGAKGLHEGQLKSTKGYGIIYVDIRCYSC